MGTHLSPPSLAFSRTAGPGCAPAHLGQLRPTLYASEACWQVPVPRAGLAAEPAAYG